MEKCIAKKLYYVFDKNVDQRVIQKAKSISEDIDGIPVHISHNDYKSEGYTILINENKIDINAESGAGAFYALITLKNLIEENDGIIQCCEIKDNPDMKYRGFYQDISRGRIPTLDSLKRLVDIMAENKMNSLQLYIEHTFEFNEYKHCMDELGYMTVEEIKELDRYCYDRYIELIPSLSCFGHLYHLLQSEKYKHLSELKNYIPTRHYFIERIFHHTINPLLDDSFELVTSLIDQHIEAFSSDYFNICCDETFDLGTDVNRDKDKGKLYVDFVKKLVKYLKSKGKTVMMWDDIATKYPQCVDELSDNAIFLHWDYNRVPSQLGVSRLKDNKQIVCPGTSSWLGFSEKTTIEVPNIMKLAEYGYMYGAIGILNTNWGDFGNIASIDMSMYGLVLGAAIGWDRDFRISDEWKKKISKKLYGSDKVLPILELFGEIECHTNWRALIEYPFDWQKMFGITENTIKTTMLKCNEIISMINELNLENDYIKREFLIAAEGYALICKWYSRCFGYCVDCIVDYEKWLKIYKDAWLTNSKKSELDAVVSLFSELEKNNFKHLLN